jgi:hypothetical protein
MFLCFARKTLLWQKYSQPGRVFLSGYPSVYQEIPGFPAGDGDYSSTFLTVYDPQSKQLSLGDHHGCQP